MVVLGGSPFEIIRRDTFFFPLTFELSFLFFSKYDPSVTQIEVHSCLCDSFPSCMGSSENSFMLFYMFDFGKWRPRLSPIRPNLPCILGSCNCAFVLFCPCRSVSHVAMVAHIFSLLRILSSLCAVRHNGVGAKLHWVDNLISLTVLACFFFLVTIMGQSCLCPALHSSWWVLLTFVWAFTLPPLIVLLFPVSPCQQLVPLYESSSPDTG